MAMAAAQRASARPRGRCATAGERHARLRASHFRRREQTKARAIISETLDVDEADITDDTEFKALEADSFDMLELVSAFEDEFEMEMPDDGMERVVTVGDVVNAIEELQ